MPEVRAVLGSESRELEPADLAEAERLGHRDRAIVELRVGREQLDLDGAAEQRAQREQRLESGHTCRPRR